MQKGSRSRVTTEDIRQNVIIICFSGHEYFVMNSLLESQISLKQKFPSPTPYIKPFFLYTHIQSYHGVKTTQKLTLIKYYHYHHNHCPTLISEFCYLKIQFSDNRLKQTIQINNPRVNFWDINGRALRCPLAIPKFILVI